MEGSARRTYKQAESAQRGSGVVRKGLNGGKVHSFTSERGEDEGGGWEEVENVVHGLSERFERASEGL